MPSLAKYILGLGLIVGLAFASVTVKLGRRTAFGHFRAQGGLALLQSGLDGAQRFLTSNSQNWWSDWRAWRAKRRAAHVQKGVLKRTKSKRSRARPNRNSGNRGVNRTPRTPNKRVEPSQIQTSRGAVARVKRLKAAAKAMRAPPSPRGQSTVRGKRTTIDEPISSGDQKALDDLLSSAVTDD